MVKQRVQQRSASNVCVSVSAQRGDRSARRAERGEAEEQRRNRHSRGERSQQRVAILVCACTRLLLLWCVVTSAVSLPLRVCLCAFAAAAPAASRRGAEEKHTTNNKTHTSSSEGGMKVESAALLLLPSGRRSSLCVLRVAADPLLRQTMSNAAWCDDDRRSFE